ncbi:unnamed protein product, partial [Iphiclides podalirius]
MENTNNKQRTPRCREWERQRRNRFNEAITKLGEVVKEMIKNDTKSESADNVQYPKIEIVQKAILCLTTCAQEKTQLKAEILALQVKLDAEKNNKPDKKDACIQVSAVVCRKKKNGKYVKLVMLQKSKKKSLIDKPLLTANDVPNNKAENKSPQETITNSKTMQKLPKLLPLTNNINTKKGLENAIMMFSGAPYMLPQRPFLFPAIPPAIIFLDPNFQHINKTTAIPIVNRNIGDMTKTTMGPIMEPKPNPSKQNMSNDLTFPNYVGNQISAGSQYQPEFFNTHLMPTNMQNVNIDRTLTSFPPTSRANFNLSTIFPEITMKVQ